MRTDKIITPSTIQDNFKTFVKYITSGFHKGKYKVISFSQNDFSPY